MCPAVPVDTDEGHRGTAPGTAGASSRVFDHRCSAHHWLWRAAMVLRASWLIGLAWLSVAPRGGLAEHDGAIYVYELRLIGRRRECQLSRSNSDVYQRHPNGAEGGSDVTQTEDVVESSHREVIGHPDTRVTSSGNRADGHHVVDREDDLHRGTVAQQRAHPLVPTVSGESRGDHRVRSSGNRADGHHVVDREDDLHRGTVAQQRAHPLVPTVSGESRGDHRVR